MTIAPNFEPDAGMTALVILLRLHGVGADPDQLSHRFARRALGVEEMLICAKELGLKAHCYNTKWDRLANTPLPGIAVLRDGKFLILAKLDG